MSPITAVTQSQAGPQAIKTLPARVVTTVRRRRPESDYREYAWVVLIPFAFSHGLGRQRHFTASGSGCWPGLAVGKSALTRPGAIEGEGQREADSRPMRPSEVRDRLPQSFSDQI